MALLSGLVAGTAFLAATASARSGPACTIRNAGGVPSSVALGGWAYDVSLSCPFALKGFRLGTNKRLLSGPDKFGLKVPYAYARLKNGHQANFTCRDAVNESVTCTASAAVPAGIVISVGFDSPTVCRNTKKGQLRATLTVNGRATRVSFVGKTTSGSFTGGCG